MNFVSNDSDEIKREREKNDALRSLFPLTMGGSDDKTNYYLVDNDKSGKVNVHEKNDKRLENACNVVNELKKKSLPKFEMIDKPEEPIEIYDRPSRTNRHVRTLGLIAREPQKAIEIGYVVPRSTNHSSNARRFSAAKDVLYGVTLTDSLKNVLKDEYGNPVRQEEERGSEKGAFRHTIWQAKITADYGKGIAKQVGNAHEDNPRVNLYKRSFKDVDEADQTVDMLNNMIGRRIGEIGNTRNMRDLAFMVLDEFRYNGLYTAEPDEKGVWQVKKCRLSQEKYDVLKEHYSRVDENGYVPEELDEAQNYEQKHFITEKKVWDFIEYLIKSLSGY